ncbi:kinase [Microlunatus sp. Gsoil 973]|nr:kinase [Microlunatus sp. Gsoil 973]
MTGSIVPQTFRDQPRWWTEGTAWLDSLPQRIRRQCEMWDLTPDGTPWHGSNALALPVRRQGEPYVLRLAPPDERTRDELAALDFWNGRGTVRQYAADPEAGASLLERLDGDRTLRQVDLEPAAEILGQIMGRLAVPVDDHDVPSTNLIISRRLDELERDWTETGRPFDRAVLTDAVMAGRSLTGVGDDVAVNGDLHHDQVLAGTREPWLVVDPMLLRGDIGYDLARSLWWRLDEMPDDRTIIAQLVIIGDAAGLSRDHARTAVIFRTVDYWLWGLRNGLTEDPVRCARLIAAVR